MTIISIALVAIAGMFIQAYKATCNADDYTAATNLAQEKLERLKAQAGVNWSLLTYPYILPPETITLNNITYTRTGQAVVRSDLDAKSRVIQVSVNVSWRERDKMLSVEFTTYVIREYAQFP